VAKNERFIYYKKTEINMAYIPLENRLSELERVEQNTSELISALDSRNFSRSKTGGKFERNQRGNFKDLLTAEIEQELDKYLPKTPSNFRNKLYNLFQASELMCVYAGIQCFTDSLPDKLMSKLTAWERVTFFAGVLFDQSVDSINYSNSACGLNKLVSHYIKTGYDKLHQRHMIKYNRGTYKKALKIPESQYFRKKKKAEEKKTKDVTPVVKKDKSVNRSSKSVQRELDFTGTRLKSNDPKKSYESPLVYRSTSQADKSVADLPLFRFRH